MATQEPVFRHGIRTVCRESGISPDVLRAWERRYGVVSPRRTPTNRRLYSDEQITRLALLRRAVAAGIGIGEASRTSTEELERTLARIEAGATPAKGPGAGGAGVTGQAGAHRPPAAGTIEADALQALRQSCLDALIRLDEPLLRERLRGAALGLPRQALLDDLLTPLLRNVGERWKDGSLRVCQEHLASAQVRALLQEILAADANPFSGPEIVIGCPAGQSHEIGGLMAALVAAGERWRVTWLGADLPAEEIAHVVASRRPAALGLSLIYPAGDARVAGELRRLATLLPPGTRVLAGGAGAESYREPLAEAKAEILSDLDALRLALRRARL